MIARIWHGVTPAARADAYTLDAIRRFAGEAYEKARYYPEDGDFLLEFEPGVVHYDVVAAP